MSKKIIFTFFLILISALVFANQVDSKLNPKDSEVLVNKVKVKITLPDSNVAWAVVEENGNLEITMREKHFIFSPMIINLEKKTVVIENIHNNSNAEVDLFQFEIIDIISLPLSQLQKQGCSCCVTCEETNTKVCACMVEMCGDSCCRCSCCGDEEE
ncbi:MAG: hypothetical protein KAW12_07475 [Candidatus Aminicenantes bacterium]|nr:hypothetical protein [Candidatus Aminicenantes bacterium]